MFPLTGRWMGKGNLTGTQCDISTYPLCLRIIFLVSHQRMTDGSHLYTDLMMAAGIQMNPDQTFICLRLLLQHFIAEPRVFCIFFSRLCHTGQIVSSISHQIMLQHALLLRKFSLYDRQIIFIRRPLGNLL